MVAERNCDGPLDARPAEDVVMHPEIPPTLWQPWCPFRALDAPGVLPWLRLYGRWQRYQVLPEAGGLDDQEERVLDAFDTMTWALRQETLADVRARG